MDLRLSRLMLDRWGDEVSTHSDSDEDSESESESDAEEDTRLDQMCHLLTLTCEIHVIYMVWQLGDLGGRCGRDRVVSSN